MRASRLLAAAAAPIAALCKAPVLLASAGDEDRHLSKSVISSPMRDNYFVKIGTPELHDSIMIHYDSRTRNAKWVVEHLRKSSEGIKAFRKDYRFYQDASIDVPEFRSLNEQYIDSKLDRGHLAAAANWRHSPALMKSTFSLMNISPQEGEGFNRSYWARLEAFVRHLANTFDDVKVCTGPVFAPARLPTGQWVHVNRTIGEFPNLVSVPTHFFKVIYAVKNQGRGAGGRLEVVGAFMVPNKPIDKDMPLEAFAVKIADLEALTGTRFLFTGLSAEQRDALDGRWATVPQLRGLALGQTLEHNLCYGVQRPADHPNLPEPPLLIGDVKPKKAITNKSSSTALVPVASSAATAVVPSSPSSLSSSSSSSSSQLCHLCEIVPCVLPPPYAERVKGRASSDNGDSSLDD